MVIVWMAEKMYLEIFTVLNLSKSELQRFRELFKFLSRSKRKLFFVEIIRDP